MPVEQFIVIHFGQHISRNMYEHDIDINIWQKWLDIQKKQLWTNTICEQKYKTYCIDNLMYEFDVQTNKYVCYYDHINNVQSLTLPTNNIGDKLCHSLCYEVTRESIDYEFLPINKYYNENEFLRTIFENDKIKIIFEIQKKSHEIKIIMKNLLTWKKDLYEVLSISDLKITKIEL